MSAAASRDRDRTSQERRRARAGGFSLIEVLIALSILLVGGVSILAVFALAGFHGIRRQIEANVDRLRQEVATVAQDVLDSTPADRPPPAVKDRATSRPGYTVSVEYARSPNGDPSWVARITISYRGQELSQGLLPPVWLHRSILDPGALEPRAGRSRP